MNTNRISTICLSRTARLLVTCCLLLALVTPGFASYTPATQSLAFQPGAPVGPDIWTVAEDVPIEMMSWSLQCPDQPDSFYMVGGITRDNVTTDAVYRYDADTDSWDTTLAPMPQPRRGHALACYQGKIYVAGGWETVIHDTLYIYDIISNTWSQGANLPDIVWAAFLGAWDGKLYLVGGTRLGDPYLPVNRVDVYDIATDTWSAGGGTPMLAATDFAASVQAGPFLYIAGGLVGDGINLRDDVQRYDMANDAWELGPTLTVPLWGGGMAISESRLYLLGGSDNPVTWNVLDKVDFLELVDWPGGAWVDLGDPLLQPNIYPASACTNAVAGGEIWAAAGGLDGFTLYTTNLYRPAETCLGNTYAFTLAPDSQSGSGYRGGIAEYTLTVTNTGDAPDAYDIAVSSVWAATASVALSLWPGESAAITVTVEVPYTATLGDSDTATISITSQGNPAQSDSSTLTTTAVTDWTQAAKLHQPLFTFSVQCPEQPESFYLVGGVTTGWVDVADLSRYDADKNSWDTTLAPMPQPRRAPALACYGGKIYVAGGYYFTTLNSLFIYDIASDSWSQGAHLPNTVVGAMTGTWDGKLYLAGGTRVLLDPYLPVDRVDVYDIATDTWSVGGGTSMPAATDFAASVQAGPYLYIAGGFVGDGVHLHDEVQRYDMASDAWELGPALTIPQWAGGLAINESRLYLLGGSDEAYNWNPLDKVDVLELADWHGGAWASLGDLLPQVNIYPASACTNAIVGGEVWAVGGGDATDTFYDTNLYHRAEPCLGNTFTFDLAPKSLAGEGKPGEVVTYTLAVTNTGDTPDAYSVLVTSTWEAEAPEVVGALDPGESASLVVTVEVPAGAAPDEAGTTMVLVTSQGDPTQSDSASLTTTALEASAYLQIAHLAPFAIDPGTVVTVTLDGTSVLTGFEFADSTGYIPVTANLTHTLEIFAAGVTTPAISADINLMAGGYYSGIAIGGANDWLLELLALGDDNSPPVAGFFHLRMGHLAPFNETITGTLADVRLQDGTVILDDVPYGAVTGFQPLPAGEYDLVITSPDGLVIYIDPLPVTFNEGDIVSAYAVGDGANQSLGVFAWYSGEPGALLPLVEPGAALSPTSAAQNDYPGEVAEYNLTLSNTGNFTDTFDLAFAGNAWAVTLPVTQTTLAAGTSLEVTVQVLVPVGAADGDQDSVTITATSQGDPTVTASGELTTTAVWMKVYMPFIKK
jgi:N-acetylneuraminic acid mutarotase